MIGKSFLRHAGSKAKLSNSITERYADGFVGHLPILGLCDLIVNTLIVTFRSKNKEQQMNSPLKTASLLLVLLLPIESQATQGYQLSQIEIKALENILQMDIKDFIEGSNSLYQKIYDKDFVYGSDISSTYKENEVAADLKYKNKQLFVIGKVESINSGMDDKPFLTLEADSYFTETRVYFKDPQKNIQIIAALRKGDKINLACIGAGEIMGSPSLINCMTTKEFASETKLYDRNKALYLDYYANKEIDQDIKLKKSDFDSVMALPLILANLPNSQSICPLIRTNCGMDLVSQLKGCSINGEGSCDNETKNDIKETFKKVTLKLKQARGEQ